MSTSLVDLGKKMTGGSHKMYGLQGRIIYSKYMQIHFVPTYQSEGDGGREGERERETYMRTYVTYLPTYNTLH